jgi:heat shock protein HslJ
MRIDDIAWSLQFKRYRSRHLEKLMSLLRVLAGWTFVLRGIFAACLSLLGCDLVMGTDQFPFDQELLLDAAPMKPAKRMPILTVAPDGKATIGLWCKTVTAQVEVSDAEIKIEPGPMPEGLPEMMGSGQCAPDRMQADQELLAAFSQVTNWRTKGSVLVLEGPTKLKFHPATN